MTFQEAKIVEVRQYASFLVEGEKKEDSNKFQGS